MKHQKLALMAAALALVAAFAAAFNAGRATAASASKECQTLNFATPFKGTFE